MREERLEDLLARLEQERAVADERYNSALTSLDRAVQSRPEIPSPPPPYDDAKIDEINSKWDILPAGAPAVDGSVKGRLRGFIWRIVGPPFDQQKGFNAAIVDHLNRNRIAHREAAAAARTLIDMVREHIDGLVQFQHLLIAYLQTVTLYVDTKDRWSASFGQILNAAIDRLTDDWLKRWESLTARELRFNGRVAALDDLRASVALAQQTSLTLKREVERLLDRSSSQISGAAASTTADRQTAVPSGEAAALTDLDSFKYVGFEDSFRGSRDDIRDRLAAYVPKFEGLSDVLDIGCGRGEFLDLLRERGIRGKGIDVNHEMVEVSRSRGLDVSKADALAYLSQLDDASLGGVFAAQVVEHLDPAYLMRLIEACYHKVRPGGLIVLETINPACWLAFFESYIRDLTHVRPLHPETLQYLLRVSGFQNVGIEYKSPVAESSRLQPVALAPHDSASPLADLVSTFNENVAKLNARMFTYQDYAAIGSK
jgi:SAM-dependent methyltransferase